MALLFDAARHVYTLDGEEVPSVTGIIGSLYAGAFDNIPAAVMERKRALGTAVHYATELDDQGNLGEIDPALQPYLDAWRKFKQDTQIEIVATERAYGHTVYKFAGTVDRIGRIGSNLWMLDIKTTAVMARPVGVQLAAYTMLATHNGIEGITHAGAVQLADDGTYKLHDFTPHLTDDRRCFIACLSLHQWKRKFA